jgi:o-succinylbenzoate---CoA ligase
MKQPLACIKNLKDNWLIGDESSQFQQIAEELYLELLTYLSLSGTPPKIIIAERQPVKFLASFIAACAANCPVFLCNPDWGRQEWQQVFDLVQPDIICENGEKLSINNYQLPITNPKSVLESLAVPKPTPFGFPVTWVGKPSRSAVSPPSQFAQRREPPQATGSTFCKIQNRIMIPTGGSSGKIKFAIHTWETLTASVQGFKEYFQLNQINSFCVLPLYHVSGLMQFMRSFTTGGKLAILPFKEVESGQVYKPEKLETDKYFISLVPTQLHRILQNPKLTEWLSQFQTVLLGGAPAWDELLDKARHYKIRLSPTYGITETASQIATLKPDDFLNGKVNCGRILPHAQVKICNDLGEILHANQVGNIRIQAKSLALGYYKLNFQYREAEPPSNVSQAELRNQKRNNNTNNKTDYLQIDDLGFLDAEGYLNIVGRSSDKIITGGENVYPIEVESAIRATKMVADVCVIGIPDKYWGQAVTAIYIPQNSNISSLKIQTLLKSQLCKFKIPKHWIPVPNLPRNSQGKINRQQLQQDVINLLQTPLALT